jgi:hypothetical protein
MNGTDPTDFAISLMVVCAILMVLCAAAYLCEDLWPRLQASHRRRMARVHRHEHQRAQQLLQRRQWDAYTCDRRLCQLDHLEVIE